MTGNLAVSLNYDRYRPDIDGLRAIAIALVVVYHAFPKTLPGGFIGVDIFFVISGYLITGIIARELGAGTFTVTGFYERRIRRIFPALIVVLMVTLLAGCRLFLPSELRQLGLNTFAGAAFLSNIASLMQSGYFDIASSSRPLLHLWSLGIEEQFYLAWPLILCAAFRLGRRILPTIAVFASVSFIANLWLAGPNPVATFYLPFTRVWELLIGGLLVLAPSRKFSQAASELKSVVGFLMIAVAVFALNPKSQFPGWWALLPVVGSALVISAPSALPNQRILATRPFVGVGIISYPLYLWHWPLLVFYASFVTRETDTKRAIAVALSVLLAWGTYSFVESYFRKGRLNHVKIAGLGGAMVFVALAGGLVQYDDGLEWRFPKEVQEVLNKGTLVEDWRTSKCMLNEQHELSVGSCVDREARPLVLVWGDSTAGALIPGLRRLQEQRHFGIAQFTISSCEPLLADVANAGRSDCKKLNEEVLDQIEKTRPTIVLLHAIWYQAPEHLDALLGTIDAIKQRKVRHIIVLGRVPVWDRGLITQMFNFYALHSYLPDRLEQPPNSNSYDAVMREKIEPTGARFVSAWDALCDDKGCLSRVPGAGGGTDIAATDQIHLTEAGSEFLIKALEPAIFPE